MHESLPLSNARRAMAEMLRYAQKVPTVPVARQFNVDELIAARDYLEEPPSWSAIFIRAYALVCARFFHLRRAWISWPSPRLHQHAHGVCAVAIEREWQGERVVLMGRIVKPEETSLAVIQKHLHDLQQADVWSISSFRMSLRFGALPTILQRLALWTRLDWSGRRRVKNIGSFGFTNYGMLGAESLHPLGPQTTVMTLGPIGPGGDVTVKLIYDHRVLDGGYIARSLAYLDEILHETILAELRRPHPRRLSA